MSGFSEKLRDSLHKLLADVVIESVGLEGFRDSEEKMRRIKEDPYLGPRVEAMSASIECFAMLQFTYPNGETYTRPVRLLGVDPQMRSDLGGFKDYLVNPLNRPKGDFSLPPEVEQEWLQREKFALEMLRLREGLPPPAPPSAPKIEELPILPPQPPKEGTVLPPPRPAVEAEDLKAPCGVIVGHLIAGYRKEVPDPATGEKKTKMEYVLHPKEEVKLLTVKGSRAEAVYDRFIVVDYFKSDMSEYDGNLVFVDIKHLQALRASDAVTSIQIKLKDYHDAKEITKRLKAMFPIICRVNTWEEKQGSLLAAIDIERGVLNVLLFLIVAVAGFGILAIFSMIVAEKTRDIGILKSLGASNGGVLHIFLSYGLLLGAVGAGLGTILGLTLTWHLNDVEKLLTKITGRQIFNPEVYYFNEIPTNIETHMVILVNLGAIAIAVAFSILPALRAALLHPVRALRFE
jgi:lipoprotein-releasing system permease protein